jgi:glycosyltransferase involved in cell wall biosynthesis
VTTRNPPARRIVYVEGNVDGTIGGSYFSLLFLVSGLDRARFEPLVVFAADNSLVPRYNAAGIRTIIHAPPKPAVMRGPLGRYLSKAVNFARGAILEPLQIAALLRRERIALVHLNNSIVRNHSWMIAARLAGVPCITHERGINPQFKVRDRRLARRLDAVICISAAVRENFIRLGLADLKLRTIHNGLDPAEMRVTRSPTEIREELRLPPGARVVGIVGNIKPWKGQDVVVRAVGLLRDEFPDVVCLLIGDTGPEESSYRKQLEETIGALGLNGRVLVTGFRKDIPNYINLLEIQIHASVLPEPFGRVLLEGMALSKPLVASGGGAVPEIVVDGETGLLFEPGNAESLAASLRALLKDGSRSAQAGRKGRQRLEAQFSIAHNVHETQALYDELLQGEPASA